MIQVKRHLHGSSLVLMLLLLLMVPVALAAQADPDLPPGVSSRIDKANYLRLRSEHLATLRGLQTPVPAYGRINAIRSLGQQERARRKLNPPLSGPRWSPIGPAPILNEPTEGGFLTPVSGRVTAVAVHPTDAAKVYVGTANGGVYRSLDGGATWTPLMDQALSLAVGAVAIDPTDPTRVWVGTGEGNLSIDSYYGVGLYRITDAESASPALEGPFTLDPAGKDVFTYASVTKILIHPTDPNTVFVATVLGFFTNGGYSPPPPRFGLYRSQNALAGDPRFSRLDVPTRASGTPILDAIFEPGNPDHLLCSAVSLFGNSAETGVWRTTNANAAAPVFTRTLPLSAPGRAMLAANRVGATVHVFVTSADPANSPHCAAGESGALRQSVDGGQTWSSPLPAAAGFCSHQCWYDSPVAVDPGNANFVYLGGQADGACSISFTRSTDGGQSFSAPGASDQGLHADTHAIAIAPSDPAILYLGNDGGIFKSTDQGRTWTSLNNAQFSATQFYSLALHPVDRDFMIGGTQDNGTPVRLAGSWTEGLVGDAGFTIIDGNAADLLTFDLYETQFNLGIGLGLRRAGSASCAVADSWAFRGCGYLPDPFPNCDGVPFSAANGLNCKDMALFLPPLARGPGRPNTLYFGSNRLYRSTNRGDTMTVVSQQFMGPQNGQRQVVVSAIAIAPSDDRIRLVGLATGQVFLTTSGGSNLADVTGPIPPRFIGRIVIDPRNADVAYVTLDGYTFQAGQAVWKTTNLTSGNPTWQAAGSGIPDIPVNALTVDPTNSQVVFAGTDIGVYYSANGGGQWQPFSDGLPRVPVLDIGFQGTRRVLRAATHGRGIWEVELPAPCVADAQTLCLLGPRFSVEAAWTNQFNGTSGKAFAIPSTDSTGFFYFTDPTNYELIVKILDFGNVVKVFYGELTDLHFTITVSDALTGAVKTYQNTPGDCGAIDETAFGAAAPGPPAAGAVAERGSCAPASHTLCLLGRRFAVTVTWMNQFNGTSGQGSPRSLSDQSGLFSFTDPTDVELVMKAVDFGDRTAFFWAALSDFGYDITVADTVGGATKTYHNPPGNYCGGLDNDAFPP